jgi:hypothetical protein
MRKTLAVYAVLAALVASPLLAAAEPPLTVVDTVLLNARIEAIDHDARKLTLVDGSGNGATVQLGPEIEDFDRLEVGDTVTFRYYESIAYAIRKPDQPRVLPSGNGETVVERGQGPNPGATLSRQQTATLTIVSVDAEAPSLTVLTEDGRRLSFRPFQHADVERLEIGDLIDVTYTYALEISALPSTAPRDELTVATAGPAHP